MRNLDIFGSKQYPSNSDPIGELTRQHELRQEEHYSANLEETLPPLEKIDVFDAEGIDQREIYKRI